MGMGQRLTNTQATQATRSLVVIHEGRDAPLRNEPTVVQEKPRLRVVFDIGQKVKSVEIDERVFERPQSSYDNHAYEAAGALVAAHYDEHQDGENNKTIVYAVAATILALSWIVPNAFEDQYAKHACRSRGRIGVRASGHWPSARSGARRSRFRYLELKRHCGRADGSPHASLASERASHDHGGQTVKRGPRRRPSTK